MNIINKLAKRLEQTNEIVQNGNILLKKNLIIGQNCQYAI